MVWLSDIINQITKYKALTVSAMIAAGAVFFLPRIDAGLITISKLPEPWDTVAFGIFVLTAMLNLIWGLHGLCILIVKLFNWASKQPYFRMFSQHEKMLLSILKHSNADYIDLSNLHYGKIGISRLEIREAVRELRSKGVIEEDMGNEDFLELSKTGREYMLKKDFTNTFKS